MAEEKKKKKFSPSQAWRDARELVWAHRGRLSLGMALMLVNRLVGLVLPASSKYLVDEVIIKHRAELLSTIALAAGAATVVQAVTSFAISQVLGVAAQRAITEMRKSVRMCESRCVGRMPKARARAICARTSASASRTSICAAATSSVG